MIRSFPFYRLSSLSLLVYFAAQTAALSSMKNLWAQGEFFAVAMGSEAIFGERKRIFRAFYFSLAPAFVIFIITLFTFGQGRVFWRFFIFKATFPALKEAAFLSVGFINICLAAVFQNRARERKGMGKIRTKAFATSALTVEVSAAMVLSFASLSRTLFDLLKIEGGKPSLFKKKGRGEAKAMIYALLAMALCMPEEKIERLKLLEKEKGEEKRERMPLKSWAFILLSLFLCSLCFLWGDFPLASSPLLASLPYLLEGGERAWAAALG
ncbi:MAG: hypothetical protein J6S17_02070 [Aeriscardovia sp.]|nr:hypothetical protein [Aeriscardovia sp.]